MFGLNTSQTQPTPGRLSQRRVNSVKQVSRVHPVNSVKPELTRVNNWSNFSFGQFRVLRILVSGSGQL
ncbi:hypothetical protein HanPSC8_Chr10g0422891 [Helianthus annuus]|nr:hypothetical protein HanPSC8_Chr10g0422891 [Helianthus annuus]